MMLLRCALMYSLLVACGSPQTKDPGPGSQQPPAKTAEEPKVAAKPVAVAIVFEGWEMWVGNDQLPDIAEHERYPGALRPLEDAFSRVGVTGFPAGSQATVITYAERATVRHPMQPIEKLTAAAFGEQKDYADTLDRNLVGGVTLALDELAKVKDARRVLVVIGDGSDSNPDAAKPALAELGKRAAAEKVEIVTLVYQAQLSPPGVARTLDPSAVAIHSADGIADQLDWLFTRLKQPPVAPMAGTKPLALVVLFSGAEVWVGNDDFTPANDPSRYEGAFKAIKAAFEKTPMTGLPKGAMVMIATYDSTAKIRWPMTPAESFDVRALGGQRDYYGTIGTELVSGATMAFTELLKVDAKQRVLVIIGDGTDTNNETAKGALTELARQAAASHIEVHAIVYKSALSSEGTVVTALDPYAPTVNSADQITAQLVALFSKLRSK